MDLQEQLEADLISAVKNKEELTVSVLRMLKGAIKNAEIASRKSLTEPEVMAILEKQAKQRRDSVEQFHLGNREDLSQKEEQELKIIEKYLPIKMSQEELAALVSQVLIDLKISSAQQTGQAIKEVLVRAKGKADGKQVADLIREKLA